MKKQLNVLIVDDCEDDRMRYSRLLFDDPGSSWAIFEARTGKDAVEMARDWHLDVALLDYSLPGRTGITVLEDIKAIQPMLAGVLLTGRDHEAIVTASIRTGAVDYLMKNNITRETLQKALNNVVEYNSMRRQIAAQQDNLKYYAKALTHDLQGPVKNMNEFTTLIVDLMRDGRHDEVRDMIPYMQKTTRYAINLIQTLALYNLLDKPAPQVELVSMNAAMDTVVFNLKSFIAERNGQVTYSENLPEVTYHSSQLVQLLQILISNALTYCLHKKPTVQIECNRNQHVWLVSIHDNGIGIAQEHRKKIFEMFTRLHRYEEFEGTGIGLSICKKIVDQHYGKIWCTSTEGKGSTFYFTILQHLEPARQGM